MALAAVAAIGAVWVGCGGSDEEDASTQASVPSEPTTTAAADRTGEPDAKRAARKPRRRAPDRRRARPSRDLSEESASLREQVIDAIRDSDGDFSKVRKRLEPIRDEIERLREESARERERERLRERRPVLPAPATGGER
ncbi:MAG: hypothetical protein ACRDK9_11740 [Solirubrobacterales bacterium]